MTDLPTVDAIRCTCGDTDGPFEKQDDGTYRCEGCIKTTGSES